VRETEEINYLTCATYTNAGCKFQPIKMCSRMRRRRGGREKIKNGCRKKHLKL
jgi:hypothetical protein